ncbi:Oidioi.mRNA.OKI2018_I69.PAR.g13194.t1.cds [Oikopleura dioica]|uniref:Oidioi.mRNA.OKI2018_I69.PAR.g13194.t1.cds n=1 Tax=Oikopleura dioica TaxID=34765 RepID=A0ABN7S7J4_OIKDI|nr:Oidioi.mRNA.OKI2018_I69.PAR.g13194.t1.cds [Oikopleura dioica]
MSVQEASVMSTYLPTTLLAQLEETTPKNLHTPSSSISNLFLPEAESDEPLQLDKAPSTMAPSTKFAVRTPALDLSTSAQDVEEIDEMDYSWYDSDTKASFYPRSPIECYMYEYYRENEEPLTIAECLFLYQKILRFGNPEERRVTGVPATSVPSRVATEGALAEQHTEPYTMSTAASKTLGTHAGEQTPLVPQRPSEAPASSWEIFTSEPFVVADLGILAAFSETTLSSNEDESSVEFAASLTANELVTEPMTETGPQSDYDCASKKYTSYDGIELTLEECESILALIPRDLLPLYMKHSTVAVLESLPPSASESSPNAPKAFLLELTGLPECSDAKARQLSKHLARRKVKTLSIERNCPNISLRLQLTSAATKKHVSHLLPRMLQKIFREEVAYRLVPADPISE